MLTVGDLKDNLIFFHILSRLNLLPIRVNVKEGTYKVLPKECKIRWGIWIILFVIGLAQLGFNATRLVQVLVYREKYLKYTHLPLHLFVLGMLSALCLWTILSFIFYPQVSAQVFREMRSRVIKEKYKTLNSEDKEKRKARNQNEYQKQPFFYQKFIQFLLLIPYMIKKVKKFKEYKNRPVVELFIIFFPYIWCVIMSSYMAVSLYDPTFEHFPVSVFIKNREDFQAQPLLWLLFLADFWTTTFWASNALTPITILVFFQNSIFKIEQTRQSLKSCQLEENTEAMSLLYKEAREAQVLVQTFNFAFAWKLFVLKNVCFSACIFMFTFSIYMVEVGENPGLIAFYVLLGAACAICYGIGCQNAFKVFGVAKKLKTELTHFSDLANLKNFYWAKLYKRTACSLRPIPIRIGNFNTMERSSILIFILIIVKYTFKLLVAIR